MPFPKGDPRAAAAGRKGGRPKASDEKKASKPESLSAATADQLEQLRHQARELVGQVDRDVVVGAILRLGLSSATPPTVQLRALVESLQHVQAGDAADVVRKRINRIEDLLGFQLPAIPDTRSEGHSEPQGAAERDEPDHRVVLPPPPVLAAQDADPQEQPPLEDLQPEDLPAPLQRQRRQPALIVRGTSGESDHRGHRARASWSGSGVRST